MNINFPGEGVANRNRVVGMQESDYPITHNLFPLSNSTIAIPRKDTFANKGTHPNTEPKGGKKVHGGMEEERINGETLRKYRKRLSGKE